MRTKWARLVALCLAACMMFTLLAFADETEPATPTDEELIAQYHIPDTWARPALIFAVRNGILYGSGDGTLSPTKNATRAELATIFSRLLPTERSIDLTAFSDLKANQWYYEPIGHAAAMGLISGTGATTMTPNGKATREQAFVMIARAFGLPAADERALYQFKDWTTISDWAIPSVAALVEAGYISGTDGYINPKNNITRQEFAQVLYSVFDLITPELAEQQDGTVLCCADTIPAGTVINGDLLLCNDAAELNLEGITVTGKLILQGVDSVNVNISGCEIGDLVLCRPATVQSDGTAQRITVIADGTTLAGTLPDVAVNADTVIDGEAENVSLLSGDLTVSEGAQVNVLLIDTTASDSTVTVDGDVAEAYVFADAAIEGAGSIGTAYVYIENFEPELMPEEIKLDEDPGLKLLQVYCTADNIPMADAPNRYVTMKFGGVFPLESCDIVWYVDGEYRAADANVTITKTRTIRHKFDFSGDFFHTAGRTITAEFRYKGQTRTYEFFIPIENAYLTEVSDVHSIDVAAKVNYRANMYENKDLTGYICGVPKGTEVIYMMHADPDSAKIRLPDGRIGWVNWYALDISYETYYTRQDYTDDVKEMWINKQNYTSSTQYLVWCNLYTQQLNIFKGSKGNWKLVFSSDCATGSNDSPTPQEVTQILYKTNLWDFRYYYVHHVSVFDNARAFHSLPYNYDSYTPYDDTIGRPLSHGCVRLPDEGALYIWDNVPVGSTVVIY